MPSENDSQTTQQSQQDTGAAPALSTSSGAEQQPRDTRGQYEAPPNEWRYPADYEIEYLRGRTAAEGGAMMDRIYRDQIGQLGQPQRPNPADSTYNQTPQAQAPQQVPQQPAQPTPDDFLNDPAGATQRAIEYARQTQFAPSMQQMMGANAQMARAIVARDEASMFGKYGPEIDNELRRLDPGYLTVDNIRTVVDMVRGRHISEIVAEETQKAITSARQSDTLRSDTAPAGTTAASGPSVDLESEELSPEYRRVLVRHNVTPATLDEFLLSTECRSRGITLGEARKEWFEKAKKGAIITEQEIKLG